MLKDHHSKYVDFFYQQRINKIKRDTPWVSQPLYKKIQTKLHDTQPIGGSN